jgi:hypothetical protein
MKHTKYKFPLVPGPTIVSKEVMEAHSQDFPSADLEEDFFLDYQMCVTGLQKISWFISLRFFFNAYSQYKERHCYSVRRRNGCVMGCS